MNLLTSKGKGTQPIKWTHDARDALKRLGRPILPTAQLALLAVYRSFKHWLGAVLTKETPAGEQPIFFLSRPQAHKSRAQLCSD